MDSQIHPLADVQTDTVGANTKIWQFCVVLSGAKIGADCNICANVFIENDVTIGDRVTIKCGVQLWDGIQIKNDVFIGPNVTFTNDKFPRSKHYPEKFSSTIVESDASIGANATVLPVRIGRFAMVGAGAVVTQDVPPYAIVVGNPARIIGYVNAKHESVASSLGEKTAYLGKTGAKIYPISSFSDMRGSLSVLEWEKQVPFLVKRLFYTYDTISTKVRGEHAHKECHQFLIAVSGSLSVIADNGTDREEFMLDSPAKGLHLPSGIWGIQYKHKPGTVLLVLASHEYDKADYIRDYDEFVLYKKSK